MLIWHVKLKLKHVTVIDKSKRSLSETTNEAYVFFVFINLYHFFEIYLIVFLLF